MAVGRTILTRKPLAGSTRRGSQPSPSNREPKEGEATESAMPTGTQESNEIPSSSIIGQKPEVKPVEIKTEDWINAVAFLAGGEYFVSGDDIGHIRRWRVEDEMQVGITMDADDIVCSIAVPQDGKWIVTGTFCGQVMVWDAETHEKVKEFREYDEDTYVCSVDVSPDGSKIATGADDETARIWSLGTGEQLLGPFKHDDNVAAVKFSPDGHLLATATSWWPEPCIRIYDSRRNVNHLLADFRVPVIEENNHGFLAWSSDSRQLFALCDDNNIHCLDVYTGRRLSKWSIHSKYSPKCISVASNGTFIAACADSSVSFWDTTTHQQIGSVIHHRAPADSIAISEAYQLVIGGCAKITLWNLRDILPSPYCDNVSALALKARHQYALLISDTRDSA